MNRHRPKPGGGVGAECAALALGALLLAAPAGPAQSAPQRYANDSSVRPLQPDSTNADALVSAARVEAGRKNFAAAIADYRQVVVVRPGDLIARTQLARLLAWNHQYPDAIAAYGSVLDDAPGDPEALEGLATVDEWSGKLADAAAIYARLASEHPEDEGYLYQAARLEAAGGQYPAARDRLATVLALDPSRTDARLLLAQLELKQGQSASALRQFERVLHERPSDPNARMGAAQARYYTGDLEAAYADADRLVESQPGNFDALFLLASIERARGRRRQARLLLQRANQLSRHNAQVAELRETVSNESTSVLHMTAGYSREIGASTQPGPVAGAIAEDLRSFTYGSRLDFNALPRSTSSFGTSMLPSESPGGLVGGAAAPAEFLYRQTTRLFSSLTARGGIGLERFGPGLPVVLPDGSGPRPGGTLAAIGFFGGTYAPRPAWSFDLTWSHLALPYTPLAVRLGVISTRTEGGPNWAPDPRTEFHLTYFSENLASESYRQTTSTVNPATGQPLTVDAPRQESGSGGTIVFNRRVIEAGRLALDLGASALIDGYNGPRRSVELGLFTPSFYQRDLLNARLTGHLSKRWSYDLAAGFGVQQVNQRTPLKRALVVSPTLKCRISPFVSAAFGYTHYDATQTLGIVRGDGVRLGIDWKF